MIRRLAKVRPWKNARVSALPLASLLIAAACSASVDLSGSYLWDSDPSRLFVITAAGDEYMVTVYEAENERVVSEIAAYSVRKSRHGRYSLWTDSLHRDYLHIWTTTPTGLVAVRHDILRQAMTQIELHRLSGSSALIRGIEGRTAGQSEGVSPPKDEPMDVILRRRR